MKTVRTSKSRRRMSKKGEQFLTRVISGADLKTQRYPVNLDGVRSYYENEGLPPKIVAVQLSRQKTMIFRLDQEINLGRIAKNLPLPKHQSWEFGTTVNRGIQSKCEDFIILPCAYDRISLFEVLNQAVAV